jgi:hypothetical protein
VALSDQHGDLRWLPALTPRFIDMGHQVELIPAKFVAAFVTGNKSDSPDGWEIWMFTQIPSKQSCRKDRSAAGYSGVGSDVATGEVPHDAD